MNAEVLDAIKKRAFGFSYDEEVLEFEQSRGNSALVCERRGRIYFKNGFVKVLIQKGENGEIKGVKIPKNYKKIKFYLKNKPKQLNMFHLPALK